LKWWEETLAGADGQAEYGVTQEEMIALLRRKGYVLEETQISDVRFLRSGPPGSIVFECTLDGPVGSGLGPGKQRVDYVKTGSGRSLRVQGVGWRPIK